MPYHRNADLPVQVRNNLPDKAQSIYRKAYNSAWNQYASSKKPKEGADREETAHRVAWTAVKNSYKKDSNGEWVRKK